MVSQESETIPLGHHGEHGEHGVHGGGGEREAWLIGFGPLSP